jgi:hypothetical protein
MTARAPFNPADPFDANADKLRHGVADLALEVFASRTFQGLPPERQVDCMVSGLMTGAIGAMLAFVPRDAHGEFLQAVARYLPEAQQNAYDISANAPEGGLQ